VTLAPRPRKPRDLPLVLGVVGATATGKTALAETLAGKLGAEVICADSRQVFRELEIGTGKPTREERAGRPHHLFDALSLEDRATAGWYGRASAALRDELRGRGALPLFVGGSGLYLRAAQQGLAPAPPEDPLLRARLRDELAAHGPEALHAQLAAVDPVAARRIGPRDRQRIVRALEVERASGRPLTWWLSQPAAERSRERWLLLELELPAKELDARISARTRWMMSQGLLEEVRALVRAGHGDALRRLRAVGYDETLDLLEGAIDRPTAEARIDRRTRQLAKRQRTWFRHQAKTEPLDARLPLETLREQALDVVRRTIR
jgi:tRNA dimethylallyltransferase